MYNAAFEGGGEEGGLFSESYYRSLHADAFRDQFEDYRNDASTKTFQRWLQWIEKRIPAGRVLDVGSALGTFLKLAQDRGWNPSGVEISRFGATYTQEVHGIPVFNGDLDGFKAEANSFDLITYWDSIEHVTNPLENLKTACRLLRPGGIVLLTTDNFDCLIADVARFTYWASGGRLCHPVERLFIDRNCSYFTQRGLLETLKSVGLDVLLVKKMEYPLSKITTTWWESFLLRAFYAIAYLMHRQAQITVLAVKR